MDYLEYKGYKGSVEYSKEDNCLCGKVQGLGNKALILYEGNTIDELRKDFEEGVDSYLEGYKADGVEAIKAELLRLAEQGNKPFSESLNPGVPNVLGIRIPHLRELAKRIARGDWQAYLATADTYYMEERMLQGLVLGCIRPDEDVEVYLGRVTRFVHVINSWSVCDTFKFGGGKRFVEAHKERLWEYLKGWMQAEGEYEIRFGVVMTMQLFIDEEHIRELLRLYDGIRHEGYYVRMGVAWALSVCFVRFPDLTMRYLQEENTLDDFTYNKTLQKIVESYRVDADVKQVIKGMRRKS